MQGEGNEAADSGYRRASEAFVKSGRIGLRAGIAARALDGPERAGLLQADRRERS